MTNTIFSRFIQLPQERRIAVLLAIVLAELTIINFLGWGKLMAFHTSPIVLIALISYTPYIVRGVVVSTLVVLFFGYSSWSKSKINQPLKFYAPSRFWVMLNAGATLGLAFFFMVLPPNQELNSGILNLPYFLFLASPLLWGLWFVSSSAFFSSPRGVYLALRKHWRVVLIAIVISLFARGTVPGELPLEIYTKVLYFWSDVFLKPTLVVAKTLSDLIGLGITYWYDSEGQPIFGNQSYNVIILGDCSGYEGITLVAILLGIFCYLERKSLKLPQALLIFPLAMTMMFLLNVLRLIMLIEIGTFWSSEIAMAGFHPVAGWVNLVFTVVLCALILNKSPFFSRLLNVKAAKFECIPPNTQGLIDKKLVARNELGYDPDPEPQEHLECFLMPMIVWIGTGLLTQMVSPEFRWLYPLSVLLVGGLLYRNKEQYAFLRTKLNPVPLIVGALVFVFWITMIPHDPIVSDKFETSLFGVPPLATILWLLFRVIGTTLMVPILEELAFRGFMQPQIQEYVQDKFVLSKTLSFIFSLTITSLAFGLMHSEWAAGTVAGICYGLLRQWRGKVGDAVIAHGFTNFLLAIYVLIFGYWSYF